MKTFPVFLAAFTVYVFCAFPALAPYRDSGEMTSAAATLGVAHPPSYPLYVLTGNIAGRLLPTGNYAYRITVLSALFMAGAVAVFLRIAQKNLRLPGLTAAAAALGFGFSYFYRYLAAVQEMYTMSIFLTLAATAFLLDSKLLAAFFALGVSAGARTDAALVYPAFMIYAFMKKASLKDIAKAHMALAAGLSVFLYSWVRAQTGPLINWGDLSSLSRLADSLMRRSHGGTLDLISSGYAAGENFSVQMKYYARHLWRDFTPAGALAAAAGAVYLFRRKKEVFFMAAAAFGVSGILFMYLANMPPNTHALAILEAHFLMPDIFFCFFAAAGAGYIFSEASERGETAKKSAAGAAVLTAAWIFAVSHRDVCKRYNFFLTDYAANISASAADATVIIKEDVQVFSMWHRRYVEKPRGETLKIVTQGLAGSKWYASMNSGYGVRLTPLRNSDDWAAFVAANGRVFFSNDADFPGSDAGTTPAGLLNFAGKEPQPAGALLDHVYIYRGDWRYGAYREFFTPDLIEDYAKAWHREGFRLMREGKNREAEKRFLVSLYMREDFPLAAYHLGWCRFSENDFDGAMRYYKYAAALYARYIAMADEYRAADDVRAAVRREAAETWLHKGVTAEKLNRDGDALDFYSKAARLSPRFSAAFYNMAAVHWKRGDFVSARINLLKTLEADPGHADARRYLAALERMGG